MNPKLMKKQFEKSFETYNQNAIVQKIMAEKLVSELIKIKKDFKNVLELGCGSGLLTSEIANNINYENYFANDLVSKSEKYIKKIIPEGIFYHGDARKINPSKKMDLIISNAMFQWFENIEKTSELFKQFLNKGGILAFTTFSPENYKEIKDLTGLTLNYKKLDELEKIFSQNYKILYSEEIKHTMRFSSSLELLAHMKKTGVNSIITKHWTFKEIKDFCHKYTEKYPDNQLTYCGIILIVYQSEDISSSSS